MLRKEMLDFNENTQTILFATTNPFIKNRLLELGQKSLHVNIEIVTDKQFFKQEQEFSNYVRDKNIKLVILFSFGSIIKEQALRLVPMLNVHFSLLPQYRGAVPLVASFLNNEQYTGVTIHKVVPEVDAGDIFVQVKTQVKEQENAKTTFERLTEITLHIFENLFNNNAIDSGLVFSDVEFVIKPDCGVNLLDLVFDLDKLDNCLVEQKGEVSFAPFALLSTQNSWIKVTHMTAQEVVNRVKAFYDNPIARTMVSFEGRDRVFLIHDARVLTLEVKDKNFLSIFKLKPGQVIFNKKYGLVVGTMLGNVQILKAGLESKKILKGSELLSLKGKLQEFK